MSTRRTIDRSECSLKRACSGQFNFGFVSAFWSEVFSCAIYDRSHDNSWFATEAGFIGNMSGVKKAAFQYFANGQVQKTLRNTLEAQGMGRNTPAEVRPFFYCICTVYFFLFRLMTLQNTIFARSRRCSPTRIISTAIIRLQSASRAAFSLLTAKSGFRCDAFRHFGLALRSAAQLDRNQAVHRDDGAQPPRLHQAHQSRVLARSRFTLKKTAYERIGRRIVV